MIIESGYKWYNGIVLTNAEMNAYNKHTIEIERLSRAEAQEKALDNRHKFLTMCFNHHRGIKPAKIGVSYNETEH